MILWTLQGLEAWRLLQDKGILRPDPTIWEKESAKERTLDDPGTPEHWMRCYCWMADQMAARIGSRLSEDALPLWAWFQAHRASKRRPDLRFNGFRDRP